MNSINNRENKLIVSDVIYLEIHKITDIFKRYQVLDTINQIKPIHYVNRQIVLRGKELEKLGFKSIDSLHIAIAESTKSD